MSNEFGGLIPLYSSLAGGALSLIGSWGGRHLVWDSRSNWLANLSPDSVWSMTQVAVHHNQSIVKKVRISPEIAV